MWGISYANLLMFMASIPDYTEDTDGKKDDENGIDTENWQKYVNK